MSLGTITRYLDATVAMEGLEVYRKYFSTEKLTFGLSEIQPGQYGEIDPGHAIADEVFFCAQGRVLCLFPEEGKYYELTKGDALLIPPGVGHQLFNIGSEAAWVVSACAPKP